nr:calreticulin-1-like [Ipomoea batatas]
MSIPSFSALMLHIVFSLTMWRSSLVAYTLIGICFHQRKLRILKPRNLKIGMTRNTLMILKIRSQRVMMTSPRRYQILMLRSLRTGMMKRMASGLPQLLPTLSTRVHGRQRKLRTPTTRGSGRHL